MFFYQSFPLVMVLMSKRTIPAYENAFQYINRNLIPLRGQAIIIDFEKAMRRGLLLVLRANGSMMAILGCWFHFCQALRRKLLKLPDLAHKIRTNDKYKDIFRRIQCLPLIRCEDIEPTFKDLGKEALKLDKKLFAPFLNYFHNEWIKTVTPKHFCVFKCTKRTTGDAESYNAKLNSIFRAHPGFYTFVETMQKIEVVSTTQLSNYMDGTQQKKHTKNFYANRSILIEKLSTEHANEPHRLLKLLANSKNKTLYDAHEIKILDEDVTITSNDEMYGLDSAAIHIADNSISESDDEVDNPEQVQEVEVPLDGNIYFSGLSGKYCK